MTGDPLRSRLLSFFTNNIYKVRVNWRSIFTTLQFDLHPVLPLSTLYVLFSHLFPFPSFTITLHRHHYSFPAIHPFRPFCPSSLPPHHLSFLPSLLFNFLSSLHLFSSSSSSSCSSSSSGSVSGLFPGWWGSRLMCHAGDCRTASSITALPVLHCSYLVVGGGGWGPSPWKLC